MPPPPLPLSPPLPPTLPDYLSTGIHLHLSSHFRVGCEGRKHAHVHFHPPLHLWGWEIIDADGDRFKAAPLISCKIRDQKGNGDTDEYRLIWQRMKKSRRRSRLWRTCLSGGGCAHSSTGGSKKKSRVYSDQFIFVSNASARTQRQLDSIQMPAPTSWKTTRFDSASFTFLGPRRSFLQRFIDRSCNGS